MILGSGYRFSEKIMLKQRAKAKYRINLKSFCFSAIAMPLDRAAANHRHFRSGA
jgi:hypothetical protein